jgi:hypothetical protein
MRKICSCRDRLCGAEDCRNCHPENIVGEDSGAEDKADRDCELMMEKRDNRENENV